MCGIPSGIPAVPGSSKILVTSATSVVLGTPCIIGHVDGLKLVMNFHAIHYSSLTSSANICFMQAQASICVQVAMLNSPDCS